MVCPSAKAIGAYTAQTRNTTASEDDALLKSLSPAQGQLFTGDQAEILKSVSAVIDAKREGEGKLRIASRVLGDAVEISFSDNGCGIPAAIRHRVFDQFFTTKQVGRGSGQGLAITRRIVVEVHHGSLDFESEVGVGTTFSIHLPVVPAERQEA